MINLYQYILPSLWWMHLFSVPRPASGYEWTTLSQVECVGYYRLPHSIIIIRSFVRSQRFNQVWPPYQSTLTIVCIITDRHTHTPAQLDPIAPPPAQIGRTATAMPNKWNAVVSHWLSEIIAQFRSVDSAMRLSVQMSIGSAKSAISLL